MGRSEAETTEAGLLYAQQNTIAIDIGKPLGVGEDGMVWLSSNNSAVKAFYREKNYENERDCYFRLQDTDTTEIAGFTVPRFLAHDDELMVVEMGLVSPPRILDFGKAYLDRPAPFPPDVLEQSMTDYAENYTEEDWHLVERAVAELRWIQIYYYDLRPGNIQVRAEK